MFLVLIIETEILILALKFPQTKLQKSILAADEEDIGRTLRNQLRQDNQLEMIFLSNLFFVRSAFLTYLRLQVNSKVIIYITLGVKSSWFVRILWM